MQLKNRRQLAGAVLLALIPVSASTALAQAERPTAGSNAVSPAQFATTLQDREKQLASIEQLSARMVGMKTIGANFGDELNEPLSAYAKGMGEAFDIAIKQAELAAKTQGKQGSSVLVKPFEDLAQSHERRMKQLDEQGKKISFQIKEGAIQIDKSLLEQLTAQERTEFLRSLSPRAAKDLEQKHPDLFKAKPGSTKSSSVSQPSGSDRVARNWRTVERISDFLIRPAHAAIALTVAGACQGAAGLPLIAAQWATCLRATQAATGEKAQAQAIYNSCAANAHGGGGKPPHWTHGHWKATMLTACATAFVIRLA